MTKVLFKPHPIQEDYINSVLSFEYKFCMFGGAAGGGKTYVSIAILIVLSKLYPGSKWYIVRESLPSLKRTSIPSFFKLCPKKFIRSYNQSEQVVEFTNGSKIFFFAENYNQDKNLTRWDGIECNGFLLEELQELQEKSFNKCFLRAGRHIIEPQPPQVVLGTCNPSQTWSKVKIYEPCKAGTLNPKYHYLPAKMSDNPSLTDDYLEGLENLDEVTRAVFVDGDWDAILAEKPFAYAFKTEIHVKEGIEWDFSDVVRLSFDFNVDPITCIAGQSYEENGKDVIRIIKEFRLRNSDIYALCEEINVYFPNNVYFWVTGDAAGNARSAMTKGATNYYKIIKNELQLSKSQFKVPSVNPSLKNSRVLTNSMFARYPVIEIDKGCRYLVEDLKLVEVNEKGEIDKTINKHRSHLLDTIRYYFWTWHQDFVRYLK